MIALDKKAVSKNITKEIRGHEISDLCKKLLADKQDKSLLSKLRQLYGDASVRLAYTSKPWFKFGGIVDAEGNVIANSLIEWVERTYLECGQDIQALIDHIIDQQLIATTVAGKSLYYVVPTGEGAEDFILLQIEKTQEKSERLLISENELPESIEDIIDPINAEYVDSFNIGPAGYQYRRKTDIAVFMQTLAEHHIDTHPVQRFINDWNKSSARKARFSDDWLIRPSQNVGRYGEDILNVELINLRKEAIAQIEDIRGKHGSSLDTVLKRFDRKAGYPFAWYFYMLKGLLDSSQSAEAVYQDLKDDFAYLPENDEKVVRAWIKNPYYIS